MDTFMSLYLTGSLIALGITISQGFTTNVKLWRYPTSLFFSWIIVGIILNDIITEAQNENIT